MKKITLLSLIFIAFLSCSKDNEVDPPTPPGGGQGGGEEPTNVTLNNESK